ncbi:MAG: Sulfate adenylyltransferase subunit 2 [Gemmatimonadetes bacterium]|nr:Sulfate adenylyltransferase subunit 2 [Gemmatimonadota bacterium]
MSVAPTSAGTGLDALENEAIEIFREGVACSAAPVMLYSIGKDSSAMLRLAQKAFWPGPLPFQLLHIDTTWKFRAMIEFRDVVAQSPGVRMLVHTNRDGLAAGINPFVHGSERYTDVMKTMALRQAIDQYGFDLAFGGARRDEEKSRAKERVFSLRTRGHRWDAKAQRPELWNLYNTRLNPGETLRVFPLSNWTEADVWRYLARERVDVVPLYFAKERPVVVREGQLIMVDDDRLPLADGEQPTLRRVRFRTLGCYPLTAAIESDAVTVDDVIADTVAARFSERQGRLIDHDGSGSMERKKQEGYF